MCDQHQPSQMRSSQLEKESAELFKVIAKAREAFKEVDPEEIERETDRIIARLRAEDRAAALDRGIG